MLIHKAPTFSIYFGDASDNLNPEVMREDGNNLFEQDYCAQLKKELPIDRLIFQHQVHGADGMLVDENNKTVRSFSRDGDFLTTRCKNVGLGVLTADCLPIVVHDIEHNAIGIAHAGWRGSVQEIAVKLLDKMKKEFRMQREQVQIFFGPAAKSCCYEIQPDFLLNLEPFSFADKTVRCENSKLYFDVALFNQLLLESHGVSSAAIIKEFNVCTLCDSSYFSHRRKPKNPRRQMTVVCLS